ncbi:lysine-specific demethylase 7A-like [Copidosoma floridanum]|uniref:lysine-specific demethylase 7A-like n=1 Tax=Copidosoma floridanum TaxID=29053 RepID=UPI000C6F4750|nr:lysine-specific demethylase 7A-like [Copidosoma floridanum]
MSEAAGAEEEEASTSFGSYCGTSETNSDMGPEMDLANRPNPWLPAYGFQIQHHNFQPTHEDLRANDRMWVQDYFNLETILEETSDDLQSDSDRSSTTYWLGSDSDNESVIHIRNGQRTTDEKHEGSGSECNSVVPKKRRRKGRNQHHHPGTEPQHHGSSSRDSSSASSRSSSLLQFESLERTCATLSLSSYSFDSLEYQHQQQRNSQSPSVARHHHHHHHRHHHHHHHGAAGGGNSREQTSPDSLELHDFGQLNGSDLSREADCGGTFARLRPYRSFESLGEKDLLAREPQIGGGSLMLANGFSSHAFVKNSDLSRVARRPRSRRRNPWQMNEVGAYSDSSDNLSSPGDDEEEEEENEEEEEELGHDYGSCPRYNEVDQLLVFGEQSSTYAHTAALDCRNSVDLRDFGLDSDDEGKRRENTLLDLKAAAIRHESPLDYDDPDVQLRKRHHHHHHHQHHHHHHARTAHHQQYTANAGVEARLSGGGGNSGTGTTSAAPGALAAAAGSGSGCFNFRFADTWRSAPSLPASLLETASSASTASLLRDERFTRVASVPAGLDLCGRNDPETRQLEGSIQARG